MSDVTVVITSCNRVDLLGQTFDSLINTNTYPIEKYIIIEDSGMFGINDFIKEKHPDLNIQLIYNEKNIGQAKSIDKAYSFVETEYIFHCEEDWCFYKPGYIELSMRLIQQPNILLCWLREDNDTNGHPIEPQIHYCGDDSFRLMSTGYLGVWNGFTWNPSLIKKSNYEKIGSYSSVGHEGEASVKYFELGFRAAKCNGGYVKHIGWGRHVN